MMKHVHRRMEARLVRTPHTCAVETAVYPHGTHFVFPESMLNTMLPVGADLFVRLAFKAARKYPKECRQTRLDIDHRILKAIREWKDQA